MRLVPRLLERSLLQNHAVVLTIAKFVTRLHVEAAYGAENSV